MALAANYYSQEYLNRPTAPATWWPAPNSHVLGSRDLARAAQGTWLGVTKQGRLAVLTNYREDSSKAVGVRSRGAIVNGFLELPPDSKQTAQEYAESLVSSGDGQLAGGFSLACGNIRGPLAVVSNRVSASDGIAWIAKGKGETVGLSNTAFGDRSWPKIVNGEKLMMDAIATSNKLHESEDDLIKRLIDLLNTDTLPRLQEGSDLETYIDLLRKSIFIPAIGEKDQTGVRHSGEELKASDVHRKTEVVSNGDAQPLYMQGLYGTQTQTVVLVHESGRVKYFERTLYDDNARMIPLGEGDRAFDFIVEG